jgi:preprotein translocase subunit SecF
VIDIVKRRYWYFLLSALIVVPGLLALFAWGLPVSIDFRGGSVYMLAFDKDADKVTADMVRAAYAKASEEYVDPVTNGPLAIGDAQVTEGKDPSTGQKIFQIRSTEVRPPQKEIIRRELAAYAPKDLAFESIGPAVGAQVTRSAAIAVIMAALGILLYLTFAFRQVPHPIRYGVAAVIAMLHDVLVVVGVAAIVGHFLGWEVDQLFLTALLTVIGFSVHDTIVVFDRIRENVGRMRGTRFDRIVNHSIIQTLDRSINTQLTAIFTLTSILVFSRGQLMQFVFWLLIGIISGTYSSIFNAAQILVVWENREWRHWFGRGRAEATQTAS